MSVDGHAEAELDRLAEDFVARTRQGELPTISSYARANPELADQITDLFPLLVDLEGTRDPDAQPGRELGDYLLLREIGRGGMGVVYEAVQKTLGRRVALKILPRQMTLDGRFLDRFRLEAQAAARLQHPHIVPVIGWGEHEGVTYYTMQYVDGCGLDDVVTHVRRLFGQSPRASGDDASGSALAHRMVSAAWNGAVESSEGDTKRERAPGSRVYYDNVVRLLLQATEGIAAAHAQGVLHRDVKPSNMLLDDKGALWITDFGLCKETDSEGPTQPGDLLGTFRYMAPERFEGVSDVQGDVYGLGITLYEMLTRTPAYEGDDRAALAAQIVNTTPTRPRKLDPRIPRDLELVVLKAIAKDRSQRYATADALAADLRAYLDRRPISARAPTLGYQLRSAVRRHKVVAALLGAALIALVGSSAYYVVNLRKKEATARLGQYIANIAAAETALRDRDAPVAARLLDEAPAEFRNWEWHHLRSRLDRSLRSFERWQWPVRFVAYSPDGKVVATCAASKTKFHDEATGELLAQVGGRTHLRSVHWHPDSRAFAVGTREGLEVWSWPDAEHIVDKPIGGVWSVRFTGDGRSLAFGGRDGVVRVVDVKTRQETFARDLHSPIRAIATTPTSRLLAVFTLDASITVFDLDAGERLWRSTCGRRGMPSLVFVGDDRLAVPSSDGYVALMGARDGRRLHELAHEQAPTGVAVAPDGRRLLTWDGPRVHVWDPHSGQRLVTYGNDSRTTWADIRPDGARLVTGSQRGSVHEWLLPPGRDPDVRKVRFPRSESLAVSPSGDRFVTSDGAILRVFDAKTRDEIRTWIGHRANILALRFSRDGAWVASGAYDGEVLLWNAATDELVHRIPAITHEDHRRVHVAFSADSKRLFTCGSDGALAVWDVATGAALARKVVYDSWLTAVCTSRDGRWVVVGEYFGKIQVRNADDLTLIHTCEGHTSVVTDLSFRDDDSVMASSCFDRTARLWDIERGSLLRTLRSFTSESSGVADALLTVSFLPDGSRLVASSADGSAKLWDTASGQLVATLRGQGWMYGARFGPEAQRLLTIERGGIVRSWETRSFRERFSQSPTAPAPDEAARRAAHRERGTTGALVERMWKAFLPPVIDPIERDVAWAIAQDLTDAHVGAPSGELATLRGLGALRCDAADNAHREQLALRVNAEGDPGLHAIDLAVVAMLCARQGRPDEARTWMNHLHDHLAVHPDAHKARGVAALIDEARALLPD